MAKATTTVAMINGAGELRTGKVDANGRDVYRDFVVYVADFKI